MWLTFVISFLIYKGSNADPTDLLEVGSGQYQNILSHINHLINDLNVMDPSTHDIAVFRVHGFKESNKEANDLIEDPFLTLSESSKKEVDNLIEEILGRIPQLNPVLIFASEDPSIEFEINQNLRTSSLTIIVSDIADNVSESN